MGDSSAGWAFDGIGINPNFVTVWNQIARAAFPVGDLSNIRGEQWKP
jgi:hypothetical protein